MARINTILSASKNITEFLKNKGIKDDYMANDWKVIPQCYEFLQGVPLNDSIRFIPKKGYKLKIRFMYATQLLFEKYLVIAHNEETGDIKVIRDVFKTYRRALEGAFKSFVVEEKLFDVDLVKTSTEDFLVSYEDSVEFGKDYSLRITPNFFYNKISPSSPPIITIYGKHLQNASNQIQIAYSFYEIKLPTFVEKEAVEMVYNEDKTITFSAKDKVKVTDKHITPAMFKFFKQIKGKEQNYNYSFA